jgi:isoamylase
MKKEKDGSAAAGETERLGVTLLKHGINFALYLPDEKECRLNLYNRVTGKQLFSLRLTNENRRGNIFSVFIKTNQFKKFFSDSEDWLKKLGYLYENRRGEFLDPCAPLLYGREQFGKKKTERKKLFGGIINFAFDWEGDEPLERPFQESIMYKLHVRGFTMDSSSGVSCPGTFFGVTEKISYLKELGINCCLLMPVYEFEESLESKGIYDKINYWGYAEDNTYFTPKSAYAFQKEEPGKEFKYMVKALHESGIEVILDMNFAPGTNTIVVLECLRYWVKEYHIDGFRLSNSAVPVSIIASDPVLGKTKIISEGWDYKIPPERNKTFINYGESNQNFSNTAKRLLRGDEEQVKEFAGLFTSLSEEAGTVKYLTNHDGFTLWDVFSYDRKHNGANGENNRDGQDYNYSWNCGKEGKGGKNILALRRKQMRNAFVLLLLCQGTPLMLAGDEFCNSQEGNNNPYCQDNSISWLNWGKVSEEHDITQWVKALIDIRRAHPVFRRKEPFRQMDYIACGMPDLSFHGTSPWYPDYDHYSRQLGIMLCGAYTATDRNLYDASFYLAYNFHQEIQDFNLPKAREGEEWVLFLSTAEAYCWNNKNQEAVIESAKEERFSLEGRSIKIFIARKELKK